MSLLMQLFSTSCWPLWKFYPSYQKAGFKARLNFFLYSWYRTHSGLLRCSSPQRWQWSAKRLNFSAVLLLCFWEFCALARCRVEWKYFKLHVRKPAYTRVAHNPKLILDWSLLLIINIFISKYGGLRQQYYCLFKLL